MSPDKRDFPVIEGRSGEHELFGSLISGSTAQIVVAVAAVLVICYAAKLPLITICMALLIAFILAPISELLERWRLPRWASSFIAVILLLGGMYGVAYFSYNK